VWAGGASPRSSYYRPLFLTWLVLNHSLFGLAPAGWHLMLILLHLLATYLTFRLVIDITGDTIASALAALIFGLHPVHVESVAWISGATDVLCAVALLCASIALERALKNERAGLWAGLSFLSFAVALLFKETACVWPAIAFVQIAAHGDSTDRGRTRALFGWA